MPLYITSLNSGSNGNCYYVGSENDAVFIDAGISCRETENRMARLGLSMDRIRAIFLSHEHSDHTGGAEVLSRRYGIPVFMSMAGYRNSRINIEEEFLIPLAVYSPVQFGDLVINAFPKMHDALDPHSFTVSGKGITVGILTDIGSVCEHVINNFRLCHAAFLEANYDEVMLEEGNYPPFLKKRIRGDHGHLSNRQALELFTGQRSPFMSHLLLSHLSRDNNSPNRVLDLFMKHAGGTRIAIASRYEESAVYCINGNESNVAPAVKIASSAKPIQMTLF